MASLRIDRQPPPDDMDPDDPNYGCGYAYDHDVKETYRGLDGVSWVCRRCDADGWEPVEGAGDEH